MKVLQLLFLYLNILYKMHNSEIYELNPIVLNLLFMGCYMLYLNLINSSELNEKYREKYEEAEKNKEKYRQTLEQLPQGVLVYDKKTKRINYHNQGFQHILLKSINNPPCHENNSDSEDEEH